MNPYPEQWSKKLGLVFNGRFLCLSYDSTHLRIQLIFYLPELWWCFLLINFGVQSCLLRFAVWIYWGWYTTSSVFLLHLPNAGPVVQDDQCNDADHHQTNGRRILSNNTALAVKTKTPNPGCLETWWEMGEPSNPNNTYIIYTRTQLITIIQGMFGGDCLTKPSNLGVTLAKICPRCIVIFACIDQTVKIDIYTKKFVGTRTSLMDPIG